MVACDNALPLTACEISVRFGGLLALDRVNITVRPARILGLIGPNGAGKTTLVNVLSGLQRPSFGEVRIGGESMLRWPAHVVARSGVARTFQGVRLFRTLTVWENVIAGAIGRGLSIQRANDVTVDVLEWVGLIDQSSVRASALPYGAERRVGIARALAMSPRFLLLDEPAAGLNEAESDDLALLISAIPKRFGCGVLLIEHNMRVVMRVCHTLHVLDGGKTISEGEAEKVRCDPEVIRAYLGTSIVVPYASKN